MKYFLSILAMFIMTACGDGAANMAVNPDPNIPQNTTLWGLGDESAPPPPKLAITPAFMQTYKTCGKSFILCNPKIKEGLKLSGAIYLNQLAIDNEKNTNEEAKEQSSQSEEQQAPLQGPAIINQLQLFGPIKVLN